VLLVVHLALIAWASNSTLGVAVVLSSMAIPLVAGGVTAYVAGRRWFGVSLAVGAVGGGAIALLNLLTAWWGGSSRPPDVVEGMLMVVSSVVFEVPLVLIGGAVVFLSLRGRYT